MNKIYELYEKCGIKYKPTLKKWMDDKMFHWIAQIDPEVLSQLSNEELEEYDEVWNNEMYTPLTFLMNHDKVNMSFFRSKILNNQFWGSAEEKEDFHNAVINYIKRNDYEIYKSFGETYVAETIDDIIASNQNFDINDFYSRFDLSKALEENRLACKYFIFSFREIRQVVTKEDEEFFAVHQEKVLKYILDNFDVLAEKFINGQERFQITHVSNRQYSILSNDPLNILADLIHRRFGFDSKYKNEFLTTLHLNNLLETDLESAIKLFNDIETVFPNTYKKYQDHRKLKNKNPTKSLVDLDESTITVEKFHDFLDNYADEMDIHLHAGNMKWHRLINTDTDLNYKFKDHMYITQFTEEFINFYLDIAIDAFTKKDERTKSYKWTSFYQDLAWCVMYLCKEQNEPWIKDAIAKLLSCELFHNNIIQYTQDNGLTGVIEIIADIDPDFVKKKYDHEKLFTNAVIKLKGGW